MRSFCGYFNPFNSILRHACSAFVRTGMFIGAHAREFEGCVPRMFHGVFGGDSGGQGGRVLTMLRFVY